MEKDDHRQTIADSNQEVREETGHESGKPENPKGRENRKPKSSEPITEENRELNDGGKG